MEKLPHFLRPRENTSVDIQDAHVYYTSSNHESQYYIQGFFSVGDTLHATVFYNGRQNSFSLSGEQIRKFPHDFTLQHLTSHHEKTCKDDFDFLEGRLERLTPDYARWIDGEYRIMEFATAKYGIDVNLERVYTKKTDKYMELVTTLRDNGINVKFDVIVVSRNKIVSSLQFDQSTVNMLCKRYLAAFTFIDNLRRTNPALSHLFMSHSRTREVPVDLSSTMASIATRKEEILSCYPKHVNDLDTVEFDKSCLIPAIFKERSKMLNTSFNLPSHHEIIENGGRIDNEDSVSRVPLIIPEHNIKNMDTSDLSTWLSQKVDTTLGKLWSFALASYNSDPAKHQTLDNCPKDSIDFPAAVSRLQNLPLEYRLNHYRVEIPLTFDDLMNLAMVGVMAKSFKNHPTIRHKRKQSQMHFSSDTITEDIHEFLHRVDECMDQTFVLDMQPAYDLLKHATPNTKHDPNELYLDNIDQLYRSLVFLADVAMELAASSSQRCRTKNSFILKKMKNWNCFILIKTTTSDKHIFFSLFVQVKKSLDDSAVFPKFTSVGDWRIYDFKSAQTPYLQTLITLPESYLAIKKESPTFELKNNALLGVLLALNNKSDSEEVVTKTRYIYMKGCIRPAQCRDVINCLKGLPARPRSRLTVYLIKKSIELSFRILDMRGGSDDSVIGKWSNIPAFTSNGCLRDWNDVLSVNYIGYFRNKNSFMSSNQSAAMIEKIVEPELDMQKDMEYHEKVLTGTSTNPKGMEWNAGFIDWACQEWLRSYKSSEFDDIRHQITSVFLHKLSTVKTIDLATLKASNVNTAEVPYNKEYKDLPRKKLLLVLKDELKKYGPDLSTALPYAIDVVSQRGGTMMISLFKKAQHAGLREIYVMDLASRVIQYCLEVLGRVICEFFPQEAMTHPETKVKYRQQHFLRVDHKLAECRRKSHEDIQSVTTYSNDDATKWNQYHHVQKFYHFLKHFTESSIHPFIQVGLSMWMNKRIRLDAVMLHSFYTNKYMPTNPVIKTVKEGFLNADNCVTKKGMMDLHIESGMMQGLLHYVSSAFHAVVLNAIELVSKRLILGIKTRIKEKEGVDVVFEPIVSHVVTSDDSVMCITLVSSLSLEATLLHGNLIINATKNAVSRFAGITTSEKKASHGTVSISEMNSQWMDREQVVKPKVRHILACFNYSCMGTFVEQQDQLTSLRQQALEAGVPISTVSFINYLQGVVYYRMMGSSNAPLFPIYSHMIKRLPDPNLGYYLLDPPLLSGCVNTDFNIYRSCRQGILATRYTAAVSDAQVLLGCKGNLRSDLQSQITFIRDKKYKKMLSEIDPANVRKFFNEHPDLLYRQPRDQDEVQMVLYMKMMSSNVLMAMAKDYNTQARMLASSVYLLWAPIIRTNHHLHMTLLGIETHEERKSLLEILLMEVAPLEYRCTQGESTLSEIAKQWFFPIHKEFDRLIELNCELETRIPQPQAIEPRSSTVVEVYEGIINDIPLPSLCAHKWFALRDSLLPEYLLDAYWDEVIKIYSFLHGTHDETLEASQLEYAQTLRAALDRTTIKGKTLKPSSRGGRAVRSSGLMTFISYNFFEDEVLKPADRPLREDPIRHRLRKMAMMLQLPVPDDQKLKYCQDEINRASYSEWKRQHRYGLLAFVHKNRPSHLPTFSELERVARSSDAVIGTWVVKQRRGRRGWYGNGLWTGVLYKHNRSCRVEITLLDDKVTTIQTDDVESLMMMKVKLTKLLESWKVKTDHQMAHNASTHLCNGMFCNRGTPIFKNNFAMFVEPMKEMPSLQINDGHLQVVMEGIPIYEFHPMPEMIAEGQKPKKNAVINYILENSPCPFNLMAKVIFKPQTALSIMLSNWLKTLLIQGTSVLPVQEEEMYQFEISESVMSAPLDLTEMTLNQFLDMGMDEVDKDEAESMAGHDEMEERTRWFEANIDTRSTIMPHHFHFLRAFKLESASRIRQLQDGSRFASEYDEELYKFFTGQNLPKLETVEEEEWDFDDLNTTFIESETE
nr:MAG: RNA-dependent RNA polymerase [Wenzhou bat phenuivirus 2]